MGAVDPVFQGVDTALDFGNHPAADNPAGEQGGDLLQPDLPDQSIAAAGDSLKDRETPVLKRD